MSCNKCPVGYRLESKHSCDCVPCKEHFYMDTENDTPSCHRCSVCKRREVVAVACSATQNTVCRCEDGLVYNPFRFCKPCDKGLVNRGNKCVNNTFIPPVPDGPTENLPIRKIDQTALYAMIAIFVVLFILVLIFTFIYYQYKKRRAGRQHHITPDILLEAEKLQTPPLPPKKYLRHNENHYGPMPTINRHTRMDEKCAQPLIAKKLTSKDLPFAFVQQVTSLLASSYPINYIHLSAELNCSVQFQKLLQCSPRPVEMLLDHFFSGKDPTKERLYEALISIQRPDVAEVVWDL